MGVLDGCLVIELSEVYQVPLAAQVLGDFGAEVVKIERPDTGDVLRRMDAYAAKRSLMSSYFAAVNRNKRSVCLNLKTGADRDTLKALIAHADVLMHNFRPGVMERLGLSYEDLSANNPGLVYAVATGFGESGPLSHMGGQDFVIQSLSGMAQSSAAADGMPRFANPPAVDFASGMTLAQGIILALLERERSGRGQKVSISLLDTAIAIQSLEAASQLMYGYATRWFEKGLNFVFATRDGWVTVLGFFRDNPLSLLCKAFDLPDASVQPHLRTAADQIEHRDEIESLLADRLRSMTTAEVVERLTAQDVLCAPILGLDTALDHPQVRNNGMVINVPVAGQGNVPVVANPLKLSRTPSAIRRGPPILDTDKPEILASLAKD